MVNDPVAVRKVDISEDEIGITFHGGGSEKNELMEFIRDMTKGGQALCMKQGPDGEMQTIRLGRLMTWILWKLNWN